jgi:hypothetical protein
MRRLLVISSAFALIVPLSSVAGAPPAQALSADVVISQVYGGGGNSGAPYKNDFVELFNRGGTAVSLMDWSVQYPSATGTGDFGSYPVTLLSGSLAPGQYFLVQLGGGPTGVALPTPDATAGGVLAGLGRRGIVEVCPMPRGPTSTR